MCRSAGCVCKTGIPSPAKGRGRTDLDSFVGLWIETRRRELYFILFGIPIRTSRCCHAARRRQPADCTLLPYCRVLLQLQQGSARKARCLSGSRSGGSPAQTLLHPYCL